MTDIPATGPALAGGSPAPGARPEDQVLLILAADHRDSLERELYGLAAPPTPAQAARISADKLLVYQALLDAVPQLPTGVQPSILTDEQYGASIAELASRSAGVVSLCMPLEASGEEWFRAIGRSIWWDALHAHLHHHCTADEARHRIGDAYLDYASYYLKARDGMLAGEPGPEFQ